MLDTNITKITLGGAIGAGPFNINRPLEIDLAGNNITGTLNYNFSGTGVSKLSGTGTVTEVNVTTPSASFDQGAGVTITTLNLINVAPGTYTNNGTIVTANITDTDARFLNEGTASVGTLNVDTTDFVTLGGNAPITQVVVTNAVSVNIASGTTVTDLAINGTTNVNNAGTISDLTGSGTVTVTNSGDGTITDSKNPNVTVTLPGAADQSLNKSGDLSKSGELYSASFNWSSENGIGSGTISKHTSPGGYKYFNNGAYLDINVKKDDNEYLVFNNVLESLTLQTKANGAVDSISGNATGRQAADWGKPDANHSGTKLTGNSPGKSVFYGVRQNNTNGVATVGFNAGEKRDINLTLTPKSNLAAGTYTITIQPKQQESETVGKNLGEAITYTFVIGE